MERKYVKALNFDLDTYQLKKHYPGNDYHHAYSDLRKFFRKHGFRHRQRSGYLSVNRITTVDIYRLMKELSSQLPWMGECVHKIDVTNVGNQHGLVELLKKSEHSGNEAPELYTEKY